MKLSAVVILAVVAVAASGIGTASAHSSKTNGCSERAKAPATIKNPAASALLVPRGAESIRICRYTQPANGAGHKRTLVGARVLKKGARLRQIVRRFNALKPIPAGAHSCPNDTGETATVRIRYSEDATVNVVIELRGCGVASNGSLTKWAVQPPGEALQTQLRKLAPYLSAP